MERIWILGTAALLLVSCGAQSTGGKTSSSSPAGSTAPTSTTREATTTTKVKVTTTTAPPTTTTTQPANPKLGQTFKWDDGLSVTVGAPAPYTPSEYAAADPAAAYV